MAIPIINDWAKFFANPHEGLGSSYERIILNGILQNIVQQYQVKTAIETPSFGFTGVSGINLLSLADAGVEVTLEDNDQGRLHMISELWNKLQRPLKPVHNSDFRRLDYPDRAFDLSFSFSAMWFVPDLSVFLRELSRITDKTILISVPNRDGWGYKMQLQDYSTEKYPSLHINYIDPPSIITILSSHGWQLKASEYFDCPPWPDIGMTKEELFQKWLPGCPMRKCLCQIKKQSTGRVSILDHYMGNDSGFPERMLRYQWLEKIAPEWFKKLWAHHYYMVFERSGG